jgi:RNA polymerase sigma-70 factor (ECF subfamily)
MSTDNSEEAPFVPLFESFYAAEYRKVLGMLVGLTRNSWLAEELAQDAFARAHRDWASVSVHPNSAAWVRRVAINLSRSRGRRAVAEARSLLRLGGPTNVPPPSAEWMDVWAAIENLSRRQREVIVLYYFNDLTVDEIAASLSIRGGTVRATLAQARERLANILEVSE